MYSVFYMYSGITVKLNLSELKERFGDSIDTEVLTELNPERIVINDKGSKILIQKEVKL